MKDMKFCLFIPTKVPKMETSCLHKIFQGDLNFRVWIASNKDFIFEDRLYYRISICLISPTIKFNAACCHISRIFHDKGEYLFYLFTWGLIEIYKSRKYLILIIYLEFTQIGKNKRHHRVVEKTNHFLIFTKYLPN